MSEKIIRQPGEKIEKISLPDDDVVGWIDILVEAGFTNAEIDAFMSRLNNTYKEKLKQSEIDKELSRIKEDTEKRHGHILTTEEEQRIRAGIASRFKD